MAPSESLVELSPLLFHVRVNGQFIGRDAPMIVVSATRTSSSAPAAAVVPEPMVAPVATAAPIAHSFEPPTAPSSIAAMEPLSFFEAPIDFLNDSEILADEVPAMRARLFALLDCVPGAPHLAFRPLLAAAQRCSASAFDAAVRDQGAILVLLRSTANHVLYAFFRACLCNTRSSRLLSVERTYTMHSPSVPRVAPPQDGLRALPSRLFLRSAIAAVRRCVLVARW